MCAHTSVRLGGGGHMCVRAQTRRRRQWADLSWFVLGGLPCLGLLLTVNYLRYGDVTDTGYPQASSWFNYPIWFGAIKILFAAGKGILWFSPLLWLALPLAAVDAQAHLRHQ